MAGHLSGPRAPAPREVLVCATNSASCGLVSDTLASAFAELDRVRTKEQTLFFGTVIDDAHLYGLLTRFQALGLRVIEMRQLPV